MSVKKIILIFLLSSVLFFSGTTIVFSGSMVKTIALSHELFITNIEKDVYVINHKFPWPANSLLVTYDGKEAVLVDTPYNNQATKLLLDWIESRFPGIKIVAISTGFHSDNLGGNGYLKQKGIAIYGSQLTLKLLKERSENTRSKLLMWLNKPALKKYYDAHATAKYIGPTKLFSLESSCSFMVDGKRVQLFYPGPNHTSDNFVVYFPDKKILFGGCTVKAAGSKRLGFIEDADIKSWKVALEKLLAKYAEAAVVVPGHGKYGGTELIKGTLTLF
ncbi:MAG: MBL fold metallo-hydrolase [Deltaproteobacteria bacterium]|nr:MBL fold metallo-hydrolase [Deltaproteobacteria bacterium]